jgi:hypothetical protein
MPEASREPQSNDSMKHLAKMGGWDVDLLVDRGAYYTCSILFPSFIIFFLEDQSINT